MSHGRFSKNKEQRIVIEEMSNIACYGECNTYIEKNEKRMLNGEVGVLKKACQYARQQCEKIQQEYQTLLENHKKLEGQYDQLWIDYEDNQEYFYYEMKKMDHLKEKEEERRNKSRYKSRKSKR